MLPTILSCTLANRSRARFSDLRPKAGFRPQACMLGAGRSYPHAQSPSEGWGQCGPLRSQALRWGGERSATASTERKLVDNSEGLGARLKVLIRDPLAWAVEESWCPGDRIRPKPAQRRACPRRWVPRPLSSMPWSIQGPEPAFTSPVDDRAGSGDPDTHCRKEESR